MCFNSPLKLQSIGVFTIPLLVVVQLSPETVVVGKYHGLVDSGVFQVVVTYYLLSERHIA